MAGKKGAASGPRIPVSWGTTTRTIKGQKKKVPAISLIQESVFKRTGLKEYKFGDNLKLTKDKKGRQRIAAQGITRSATRYVKVWFGDLGVKSKAKIWHRIPIPAGISLAKVAKQLQGAKKVVEVKFPSTPMGRNARLKNANVGRGSKPRS
jgi:hypothetical protein